MAEFILNQPSFLYWWIVLIIGLFIALVTSYLIANKKSYTVFLLCVLVLLAISYFILLVTVGNFGGYLRNLLFGSVAAMCYLTALSLPILLISRFVKTKYVVLYLVGSISAFIATLFIPVVLIYGACYITGDCI